MTLDLSFQAFSWFGIDMWCLEVTTLMSGPGARVDVAVVPDGALSIEIYWICRDSGKQNEQVQTQKSEIRIAFKISTTLQVDTSRP